MSLGSITEISKEKLPKQGRKSRMTEQGAFIPHPKVRSHTTPADSKSASHTDLRMNHEKFFLKLITIVGEDQLCSNLHYLRKKRSNCFYEVQWNPPYMEVGLYAQDTR